MARHALTPAEVPLPQERIVMPGTVGQQIVEYADQIEWHESHPDNPYAAGFAGQIHEDLLLGLAEFRRELKTLTEEQKTRLAPYVQSLLPDRIKAEEVDDPSVIDRLVSEIPDNEIVDLLRGHVKILEEQHHDNAAFIYEQQEAYAEALLLGMHEGGWVSNDAFEASQAAAQTTVHIGDFWGTHINGHLGYFMRGQNDIVVAQGLGETRKDRNRDLRFNAQMAQYHENYHKDFGSQLPDEYELIDEAAAAHLALSMRYGEPDVLDPDARKYDDGINYHRRKLIAEVMEGIDPALYTRAVTSKGINSSDWRALDEALAQKYGVTDVMRSLCEAKERNFEELQMFEPDEPAWELNEKAAQLTRKDLFLSVELVLNRPRHYKKPRHVGATALSRLRRVISL